MIALGEAKGKQYVALRPVLNVEFGLTGCPAAGGWDRRLRDVTPQPSSGPGKFLAGHARIQFGNRRASLSSASRRDLATAMSGAIEQSRSSARVLESVAEGCRTVTPRASAARSLPAALVCRGVGRLFRRDHSGWAEARACTS